MRNSDMSQDVQAAEQIPDGEGARANGGQTIFHFPSLTTASCRDANTK